MEECLRGCKGKGVTQLELDVVKTNERAVQMCRGFGFEIIGARENALRYPGGSFADEYLMLKKL